MQKMMMNQFIVIYFPIATKKMQTRVSHCFHGIFFSFLLKFWQILSKLIKIRFKIIPKFPNFFVEK